LFIPPHHKNFPQHKKNLIDKIKKRKKKEKNIFDREKFESKETKMNN
jgi:hypothetical protein